MYDNFHLDSPKKFKSPWFDPHFTTLLNRATPSRDELVSGFCDRYLIFVHCLFIHINVNHRMLLKLFYFASICVQR